MMRRKQFLNLIVTRMALLTCLLFSATSLSAQEAYKIDEAINPRCDLSEVPQVTDTPMPLFKALAENRAAKVAIIVHGMPGAARVYGKDVKRWLTEERGVDPARLVALYGGASNEMRLELWLIPQGASPPKVMPDEDYKTATHFDSYAYQGGEMCDAGRLPALDEFAEMLKKRPDWHGSIVVRPHINKRGVKPGDAEWDPDGLVSRQEALRRAAKDKRYLVRKFGLSPARLTAVVGDNDTWTHAELWLVPPGAETPVAKTK